MDDAAKDAYIAKLESGMKATVGLIAGATGSKSAASEAAFMQWRRTFPLGVLGPEDRAAMRSLLSISGREFHRLEAKFKEQNPRYNSALPGFDPTARRQPMVTPKKVVRQALADNTVVLSAAKAKAGQGLASAAWNVLYTGTREENKRYNATEVSKLMTGCVLQMSSGSKRERDGTFRPNRRNRRQDDAA
ncbi:hypothetical protein SEMRO_4252_G353530.1 [Seminavis robusta]|uniref:Uncharacterized protein n=1 Tax=Seminavis robusta TaxID=568900 RepID=A0A9N8F559_9STRA|nr:hypothetical protein SEMRO_4252_G353530.1 [Seminavis robusta]|eukprot:Sro4252_g353530.1 n/a (190) ;mRNA; r:1486-2055